MTMPADWKATLGPDFRGRVLYQRRFGRPSNLGANQRIELILHKINGFAMIALNGRQLREIELGDPVCRCELTDLLLPRNDLRIEVNLPRGSEDRGAGGIVGEVQLAIHETRR